MNPARFMISTPQAEGAHAADVARLGPWFHNIRLPDGTRTAPNHPLGDFPAFKWKQVAAHLPDDLTGWSALDVGCNSGFYSIELARRGARVVGIEHDRHFIRQANWLADVYGVSSLVEFRELEVYQAWKLADSFDLVLFMGVFYHLRYPLLALDLLAGMTGRLMIFQTLTLPGDDAIVQPEDLEIEQRELLAQPGWPKMAFIEHSMAGDPTNWWAPDHAAVEAMLRSAGLRVLSRPGHEIYLCEPLLQRAAEPQERLRSEINAATGRT
jgi:tRNA (mo5U34)-methyltransferase